MPRESTKVLDSEHQASTIGQLRCYLCDTPKPEYSLIRSFSEIICRGCVNYEGPDRVEQIISNARKFKGGHSILEIQSSGLDLALRPPKVSACPLMLPTPVARQSRKGGPSSRRAAAGGQPLAPTSGSFPLTLSSALQAGSSISALPTPWSKSKSQQPSKQSTHLSSTAESKPQEETLPVQQAANTANEPKRKTTNPIAKESDKLNSSVTWRTDSQESEEISLDKVIRQLDEPPKAGQNLEMNETPLEAAMPNYPSPYLGGSNNSAEVRSGSPSSQNQTRNSPLLGKRVSSLSEQQISSGQVSYSMGLPIMMPFSQPLSARESATYEILNARLSHQRSLDANNQQALHPDPFNPLASSPLYLPVTQGRPSLMSAWKGGGIHTSAHSSCPMISPYLSVGQQHLHQHPQTFANGPYCTSSHQLNPAGYHHKQLSQVQPQATLNSFLAKATGISEQRVSDGTDEMSGANFEHQQCPADYKRQRLVHAEPEVPPISGRQPEQRYSSGSATDRFEGQLDRSHPRCQAPNIIESQDSPTISQSGTKSSRMHFIEGGLFAESPTSSQIPGAKTNLPIESEWRREQLPANPVSHTHNIPKKPIYRLSPLSPPLTKRADIQSEVVCKSTAHSRKRSQPESFIDDTIESPACDLGRATRGARGSSAKRRAFQDNPEVLPAGGYNNKRTCALNSQSPNQDGSSEPEFGAERNGSNKTSKAPSKSLIEPLTMTANSTDAELEKCLGCDDSLDGKHFVQCPTVLAHKFCFPCSKKSIQQQKLDCRENKRDEDKIFCPSGKKCLLATDRSPWTFMNNEIETIFRDASSRVNMSLQPLQMAPKMKIKDYPIRNNLDKVSGALAQSITDVNKMTRQNSGSSQNTTDVNSTTLS